MAVLSKVICFASALLAAQGVLAAPTRRDTCDFGTTTPAGWQSIFSTPWCGMIVNEVQGLVKDSAAQILPTVKAQYAQAGIKANPDSVLADADKIMSCPQAKAAMTQMKANYPATGSMDLTEADINIVYADAIKRATDKTGVSADMLATIIWTESKGHPLVYGGLTQMDHVAWGQQVDKDSSLKNRYNPSDNILASAMYLKAAHDVHGGDWTTTYKNHYQDPTAKARAAAAA